MCFLLLRSINIHKETKKLSSHQNVRAVLDLKFFHVIELGMEKAAAKNMFV
jgi:hypothetical protein